MNKAVICIAREFGSGGRETGLLLSKELSIPFYDKEILRKVAEREGMDEDFVAKNEEMSPQMPSTFFSHNLLAVYYQPSFSDKIFIEQAKIIKSLAEKGPCVIVGRCGDYVLRDVPGVLKVFISAGMPYKISRKRRVAPENAELSDAEMEKHIRYMEKHRTKYYEYYTGLKKGLATNYDLCIKTDKIGPEGAAEIILSYLKHCR